MADNTILLSTNISLYDILYCMKQIPRGGIGSRQRSDAFGLRLLAGGIGEWPDGPRGSSADLSIAAGLVVEAALAWADRDYGDLGELEADAALNDAVREFKRIARLTGAPPADVP